MRFNKLWERQTRFPITYAGAFWAQMRVPCTTSPIDICWDLHTSSVWRAAAVFIALYTRAPPVQPIAPRPGTADVLFKAPRKAPLPPPPPTPPLPPPPSPPLTTTTTTILIRGPKLQGWLRTSSSSLWLARCILLYRVIFIFIFSREFSGFRRFVDSPVPSIR